MVGQIIEKNYRSVQIAHISLFIALDLDVLVAERTAPCQSYRNPAERIMSVLNLGLQNVSLSHQRMSEREAALQLSGEFEMIL